MSSVLPAGSGLGGGGTFSLSAVSFMVSLFLDGSGGSLLIG